MKRNILWNRPEPTQTEIDNRQDFSKILNSVSKTVPFYQTKWFLGGIAIVTGITISLAFIDGKESSNELAAYKIDAAAKEKPIPLEDKQGTLVVNSSIKEEETQIEKTVPEAPVEAPVKSKKTQKETSSGSLEISNDIILEALNDDLTVLENQKKVLESTAPVMPSLVSEQSRVISSTADLSEFPELNNIVYLQFEVTNDNPVFSPSILKEEWQEHILTRTADKGVYLLDLQNNGQHLYLKVTPVVPSSEIDKAKAQFQSESIKHQKSIDYINSQIDSVSIQIAEL